MAAARPIRVAIGAGFATEILIIFLHGILHVNDADTIITGTFLMGHSGHWVTPYLGNISGFGCMVRDVFDHDHQHTVHTAISHRIKYFLAAPLGLQNTCRSQQS